MYAIIKLAGKQYKVEKGDKLVVNRLKDEEGKTIKVSDVLFVGSDKETKIGTPLVDKATVSLKVLSHFKAKKIRVAKYRSKSRYRRVYGHRQHETLLEVTNIKA